jgi:hypothetical protein
VRPHQTNKYTLLHCILEELLCRLWTVQQLNAMYNCKFAKADKAHVLCDDEPLTWGSLLLDDINSQDEQQISGARYNFMGQIELDCSWQQ